MKQINNYILEKLHLNKDIDSKNQLSNDAQKLISYYETINNDDLSSVKDWFSENNVESFIIYCQDRFINKLKQNLNYNDSYFENSKVCVIDYSNYKIMCEIVTSKNYSDIGDYLIFSNKLENKKELRFWGNKHGLIIEQWEYEIVLLKNEK